MNHCVERILRRCAVGIATVCLSSGAVAGTHILFKNGRLNPATKAAKLVPVEQVEFGYFVVQFKKNILPQNRTQLESYGVEVHRYLPQDAYLVSGSGLKVQKFASDFMSEVHGVASYISHYKLSSKLTRASVFNSQQKELIRVTLFGEADRANFFKVSSKIEGLKIVVDGETSLIIEASIAAQSLLAEVQGVEWIEPFDPMDVMVLPVNEEEKVVASAVGDYSDLNGYESGTKIMNFEAAWNRGYTGKGQAVSVADTGLDLGAKGPLAVDFQNNIGGKPFGLFAKDWHDPMGHGTHVSGSVMGSGQGSQGLLRGGAYEASVFAEGMWSPMLKNLTVPAKLADLFSAAYSAGARVHTNSWGGRTKGVYDNMSAQVDQFSWDHPDMLILFAAGNNGRDDDRDGRIDANSVSSPGTAKNALTVGASENYLLSGGIQRPLKDLLKGEPWGVEPLASDKLSDDPNGIAAFSSIGPTNDGRLKPDIVAPGTNILSNCSHVAGASPLWGKYNEDYCYSGGTSMSTPLTAGAAAVARQYLSDQGFSNPSAALVKGLLMHTAFDMYPGQYGEVGRSRGQEMLTPGPNNNQGYGRVDMDALTSLNSKNDILVDSVGVATGQKLEFSVQNFNYSSVKVTLVYTDFPASPSVARTLVNDVDVKVVDASGRVFSNSSQVNNNEQVVVRNPMAGDLKVVVEGVNIPQGKNSKQPFALLISGR